MKRVSKLRSKKAGMAPGSLVHIGEVKANTSASVIRYDANQLTETGLASTSDLVRDTAAPPGTTYWGNVYGPASAAELSTLGKTFQLHPLVLEDILNTTQRQKIDRYDGYLYIVLHRYQLQQGQLELHQDQISLLISQDFILTFQEQPSRTFEPIRQRLRAGHGPLRKGGAEILAYSLIDAVVDDYFALIEALNRHAEDLESEILSSASPRTMENIHQFKRCVSQLRRHFYPLREVLATLYRDAPDFFKPETQIYLRDVYDHTVHILESLEDLRDFAAGLLDIYLSTVSHRVNLEVRALTVVATVFMPATLIAGIFGMNFNEMPWLQESNGFSKALLLMALIGSLLLLAFWRRKSN